MLHRFLIPALAIHCAIFAPFPGGVAAAYAEMVDGPVTARVLRVVDGDTFLAQALVWPGHTVTVFVRIRGIDAAEMKSRCRNEHLAAIQARNALATMIDGKDVTISRIGGGKYYGRVLADVKTGEGMDIGENMLEFRYARPYRGKARPDPCR